MMGWSRGCRDPHLILGAGFVPKGFGPLAGVALPEDSDPRGRTPERSAPLETASKPARLNKNELIAFPCLNLLGHVFLNL